MDSDEALEIYLLAEDSAVASQFEAASDDAFTRESSGFDGFDTLVVAFTTLSVPVINAVGKIILEQIKARKHIKLRYGKITVEGVSEDKILALLNQLRDDVGKQ